MGLDMYLIRKKFIGAKYEHRKVSGSIKIKIDGKEIPINFNKVSYIEEEGCYWRKANHIHKWFVDKVQNGEDDCREHYVELEQLKELLKLCKEIKDKAILVEGDINNGYTLDKEGNRHYIVEKGKYIKNKDEIAKLLPTEDGFFFGSTEYNEWYMRDIDYTIQELSALIKDEEEFRKEGFCSDFYYYSSW